MRRFWSPVPLDDPPERLLLDAGESHHLLRVVGIAPGEAVEVFDGRGHAVRARLLGAREGRAELAVEAPAAVPRRPARWLLAGLSRAAAFDTVVRMATELGATVIQPVLADRSVARGDRRDRWLRIVRAAASQCGRADLPEVRAPVRLAAALAALPVDLPLRLCVPGAERLAPVPGPAAVATGPEGGWSEAEVALARERGCALVGLGPTVLRADTAAAAALALLG